MQIANENQTKKLTRIMNSSLPKMPAICLVTLISFPMKSCDTNQNVDGTVLSNENLVQLKHTDTMVASMQSGVSGASASTGDSVTQTQNRTRRSRTKADTEIRKDYSDICLRARYSTQNDKCHLQVGSLVPDVCIGYLEYPEPKGTNSANQILHNWRIKRLSRVVYLADMIFVESSEVTQQDEAVLQLEDTNENEVSREVLNSLSRGLCHLDGDPFERPYIFFTCKLQNGTQILTVFKHREGKCYLFNSVLEGETLLRQFEIEVELDAEVKKKLFERTNLLKGLKLNVEDFIGIYTKNISSIINGNSVEFTSFQPKDVSAGLLGTVQRFPTGRLEMFEEFRHYDGENKSTEKRTGYFLHWYDVVDKKCIYTNTFASEVATDSTNWRTGNWKTLSCSADLREESDNNNLKFWQPVLERLVKKLSCRMPCLSKNNKVELYSRALGKGQPAPFDYSDLNLPTTLPLDSGGSVRRVLVNYSSADIDSKSYSEAAVISRYEGVQSQTPFGVKIPEFTVVSQYRPDEKCCSHILFYENKESEFDHPIIFRTPVADGDDFKTLFDDGDKRILDHCSILMNLQGTECVLNELKELKVKLKAPAYLSNKTIEDFFNTVTRAGNDDTRIIFSDCLLGTSCWIMTKSVEVPNQNDKVLVYVVGVVSETESNSGSVNRQKEMEMKFFAYRYDVNGSATNITISNVGTGLWHIQAPHQGVWARLVDCMTAAESVVKEDTAGSSSSQSEFPNAPDGSNSTTQTPSISMWESQGQTYGNHPHQSVTLPAVNHSIWVPRNKESYCSPFEVTSDCSERTIMTNVKTVDCTNHPSTNPWKRMSSEEPQPLDLSKNPRMSDNVGSD
jgi:hypothetical protein